MKTVGFLMCLGGAYGILHAFISSVSLSGLLAWPLGFALYIVAIRLFSALTYGGR